MNLNTFQTSILQNSLFIEFVENLLQPETSILWLQKTTNLLKQLTGADKLLLNVYIDNSIISTSHESFCDKLNPKFNELINAEKPFWVTESYLIPLELEGFLEIIWNNRPSVSVIESYNALFSLLTFALKNRSNLFTQKLLLSKNELIGKLENFLNVESNFINQIKFFCKEVASSLGVSRCQIKFLSNNESQVFNSSLSFEHVRDGIMESLSVVPYIENEWLNELKNNQPLVLNKSKDLIEDSPSKNVESLLSIKSILGYPLTYKNKILGVIALHQCDYERVWKNDEIQLLRELSLLLSVLAGKEFELIDAQKSGKSQLDDYVINSDDFLKELHHLQIEAQVNKSCFSLLMIDIEKLKDINLNMGFVAGNLVLSQTARFLNRLFGDSYKVARYNNDEFVVIMKNVDQTKAHIEAERLKEKFSDFLVLGVGPVEFNFSFVTYPTHSSSIQDILGLLEQAMLLSKSRGKFQVSSIEEIKGQPKERWEQLLSFAIPEIIFKKTNFKTGPDLIDTINKQISDYKEARSYSTDILDSIQSLAIALDAKDSYTEGHSNRVSEYAYILAKDLSLDLQEIEWVRLAAAMHDIGKIGIPESILCKQGKLTKEEFEVMKKHPVIGAKILKPIKPLEKVANLVLYHHECWDGNGYPNGLKKEEIPIGARIVSIVDAYQAMTSNRPYRPALPFEEAISRLRGGKEKQWEPDLVEMFIKIVS